MTTPEWAEAVGSSFRFEGREHDWKFVGACPRCRHYVSLDVVGDGTTVFRGRSAVAEPMVVRCNCGSDHPGRPDGSMGCGAYAVVELEWE